MSQIENSREKAKSTMIENEMKEIEKIRKRQAKELEMMMESEMKVEIIREQNEK